MKRGREVIISMIFLALLVVPLLPLTSAGFFSDFWSKITGQAVAEVGVNITIAAVSIVSVTAVPTSLSLNPGPFKTGMLINFSAYHGAGVSQINDSTVAVNLSINVLGEENRTNATCFRTADVTTNFANYSCNVSMFWYDSNGTWNITVFLKDNNSNPAINATQTFTVQLTTGFELAPNNLTWPSMGAGAINQTSRNDPLTLNNTGNKKIGIQGWNSNISVNATHLTGETTPSQRIFASNFSIGVAGNTGTCFGAGGDCFECDTTQTVARATNMSFATYSNVSYANLTKGNYTVRDNFTGTEQLFLCLRTVDTALTAQAFSTLGNGTWVVQI